MKKVNQIVGKNQAVYTDGISFFCKCSKCHKLVKTSEMWFDTEDDTQRHYSCLSVKRISEIKEEYKNFSCPA